MAENVLLEETRFSTVLLDTNVYAMDVPAEIELVPGEAYTIRFDGTDFPCISYDASALALVAGASAVGNLALYNPSLPGNNEPFIVLDYPGGSEITVLCFEDTAPTEHTIAIYQDGEGNETEKGITLLDYKDVARDYTDVEVVRVPSTTEGEMVHYVREDLIPEPVEKTLKQSELNFSGGPIEVLPGLGEVFSKLIIPVPDGLTSANIAEGITVAGIPGSHKGGDTGDGQIKAFFKVVGIDQTTANYSTPVVIATPEELAAAGIFLDREMPMYAGPATDIAYIAISKVQMEAEATPSGVLYSHVSNMAMSASPTSSTRYRNSSYIYWSSSSSDIKAGAVNTNGPNLYPVTYGSSSQGVEVNSDGGVQVKTKSSGVRFSGTYALIVLYRKGSGT